jgi:hypothetical protein
LKVPAAAALAGISYDFGPSNITKAHLASLEINTHYFLKGYGCLPGVGSIPSPRANEAVVFEDLFTTRLHMPLHPVLADILCKFRVQLHQLMLILSFRLASSSGLLLLAEIILLLMSSLITMRCTTKTRKFILQDAILLSSPNLDVFLFTPLELEDERGLPLLCATSGLLVGMVISSIVGCLQSSRLIPEARETIC